MPDLHPLWEDAIREGRVERDKAVILFERFPNTAEHVCDRCGKLVVPTVETRYGAADPGPRHYECSGSARTFKSSMVEIAGSLVKVEEAIGALRKIRGLTGSSRRAQMERDFDRQRFDDGPESGPVKR